VTAPTPTTSTSRRTAAARLVSKVGHPALLMPAVIAFATVAGRAPVRVIIVAMMSTAAVALAVVAYSRWQVRAGRWAHVDASVPQERRQLNGFLGALLIGSAAILWRLAQPHAVVAGLALSGALVVSADVLRRWLKMSLHVSFAVFAALLCPGSGSVALLLLAVAVGWSRLVLRRHTRLEVAVGAAAGAAAGVLFNAIGG
jgi:hypothetical protein